ncbi:MAG: hypothetical protein MZU95_09670 [Desulfomicrobium escambiense]|nr:hypothetical protein [Desulfomicrobium escambiense]
METTGGLFVRLPGDSKRYRDEFLAELRRGRHSRPTVLSPSQGPGPGARA